LMRWTVPQDRKKKVRIHQDINIHFKLPKMKKPTATATPVKPPPANSMQIIYTNTGTIKGKVTKKDTAENNSGSYSYLIKW